MGTLALMGSSCTDYLDKEPSSEVSAEVAFQNFNNFQGFVEEIYNCIPDKESCYWCTTFNWGEDEIMNAGEGDAHFSHQMDLGNLKNWYSNPQHYFGGSSVNSTTDDKFSHKIWGHAFYCIRKCNLGLENLALMTSATQEERNLIEGQLYFFRAWWHEELVQYLGGLPYIDKVLDGGQALTEPRLSYRECCERIAADFAKAAELLPISWEETAPGKANSGHNQVRVTRAAALAYAGKALLWAASPLTNGDPDAIAPQPGSSNTYAYNQATAAKAAEYLGKALVTANDSKSPYALVKFDYSDIYNHTEANASDNNYHEIFYTVSQNWMQPGSTECVFRGPGHEGNGTNWNFAKLWGSKINSLVEHDKIIHMPTANYVNYAYGMANGRALDDPQSGFDPTHPFKDRDPRFYHDIIFDGFRFVTTTIGEEGDDAQFREQQYCDFETNGTMRDNNLGSRTGYFCQKLNPHQCNKYDNYYGWSFSLQAYLPYMRLAEIYLLYAEALAASGQNTSGGCTLTAVDAINVLRNRVGCAEVADDQKSGNALMETIRRERACELAFEGFRWNDLQRWCLLDKAPYNVKQSAEFSRVMPNETISVKDASGNTLTISVENEWYRNNDPRDAEVRGWSLKTIVERPFTAKHYWFPFPDSEVYLYEDFKQNPGW